MKCVSGLKIILDAGLVAAMKLPFPGLPVRSLDLNSLSLYVYIFFCFCGNIWKPRSVSVQSMLESNCGAEFDSLEVKKWGTR
jgi:hypothetical protein